MTLRRACLGCGKLGRWATRCPPCQARVDKRKREARPEMDLAAEQQRRRSAVAYWRATVGDWCPGVPELGRGAHPAANLSADHVVEVAAGGREDGPLVVRCVPCNSARSANVTRRALAELGVPPQATAAPTPRQDESATHSGGGPVVA